MAIIKCKMCGGTLEVEEGRSVAICDYCGSEQTVSTNHDEITVNLFNQASNLRLKGDY